jgi:hypothetical protein
MEIIEVSHINASKVLPRVRGRGNRQANNYSISISFTMNVKTM